MRTPHVPALVAPTDHGMPRTVDCRTRAETDEAFDARRVAAETGAPIRTIGRASNARTGKLESIPAIRADMAAPVARPGIHPGRQRPEGL